MDIELAMREYLGKAMRDAQPIYSYDVEQIVNQLLVIADARVFVGISEIAHMLDRKPPVWANWVARHSHDVPMPHHVTNAGSFWDKHDVKQWALAHHALLGPSPNCD